MASAKNSKRDVGDSAPAATSGDTEDKGTPTKAQPPKKNPKRGKNSGGSHPPNAPGKGPSPSTSNPQPVGFKEGESTLLSYGLSVSGRKERILSPVKTDKYFHFVEQAWSLLVDAKPAITERFSYAEFKHASALQLYQHLEHVKFDAIGVKPGANVRIPLPRNLRVFQPLWSVMSNIGTVTDEDLRVTYIPDEVIPTSRDLSSDEDLDNLIACTLYPWDRSWDDVKRARQDRAENNPRLGFDTLIDSNEVPQEDEATIRARIRTYRTQMNRCNEAIAAGTMRIINGVLYRIPNGTVTVHDDATTTTVPPTIEQITATEGFDTPDELQEQIDEQVSRLRSKKEAKLTIRFDVTRIPQTYQLSDGMITGSPGAYGAWMRWDPQLWMEYEQMVETIAPVAMFSISMPVETEGTYAWLLPVESRLGTDDVFCRMPKASIPPVTWIIALLLQSSTLSAIQRANFYCETDHLANVNGLRMRYLRAAVKRPAPVEQYGTY